MGGKVNVPVAYFTHGILFNENLVACLDNSGEVRYLYKINRRELQRLGSAETVIALREVGIKVSHDETATAAQFTGKDFKSADVTYFAKTYNGSAYLVLALSKIGGKIDRALGIADSEGKMVANA